MAFWSSEIYITEKKKTTICSVCFKILLNPTLNSVHIWHLKSITCIVTKQWAVIKANSITIMIIMIYNTVILSCYGHKFRSPEHSHIIMPYLQKALTLGHLLHHWRWYYSVVRVVKHIGVGVWKCYSYQGCDFISIFL